MESSISIRRLPAALAALIAVAAAGACSRGTTSAPAVSSPSSSAVDYLADGQAAAAPAGQQAAEATVVVNRRPLSPDVVAALTSAYGSVKPGRYWYDPVSGLWGLEGGPYMGQITPGLALGGPLPADISVGGTGTFINGREIHPMEYAALMRAYGQVYPGHFWLNPDGTFGQEGGPAMGNLRTQVGRGGSNGGSWSAYSPFAGTTGGDANGCLYFSGGDTSWSNC